MARRSRSRVAASLSRSRSFVLAAKVAGDGDRDGLPNVLLEAQSWLTRRDRAAVMQS
jgi:hypothetical protein